MSTFLLLREGPIRQSGFQPFIWSNGILFFGLSIFANLVSADEWQYLIFLQQAPNGHRFLKPAIKNNFVRIFEWSRTRPNFWVHWKWNHSSWLIHKPKFSLFFPSNFYFEVMWDMLNTSYQKKKVQIKGLKVLRKRN